MFSYFKGIVPRRMYVVSVAGIALTLVALLAFGVTRTVVYIVMAIQGLGLFLIWAGASQEAASSPYAWQEGTDRGGRLLQIFGVWAILAPLLVIVLSPLAGHFYHGPLLHAYNEGGRRFSRFDGSVK